MTDETSGGPLAAEIERLHEELARCADARACLDALTRVAVVGALVEPDGGKGFLDEILEAARKATRALAGAILRVDEEVGQLSFEVVQRGAGDALLSMRLPLDRGIAGFVASTGQAMAVTDVPDHPMWASEVGEQVGYRPYSILCLPIARGDRILGVLQLLDKEGGEAFDDADLDSAGRLAGLAARAIEQSRALSHLSAFLGRVLAAGDDGLPPEAPEAPEAIEAATALEGSADMRQLLETAGRLARLREQGPAARQLSAAIVDAFDAYSRARSGRRGRP